MAGFKLKKEQLHGAMTLVGWHLPFTTWFKEKTFFCPSKLVFVLNSTYPVTQVAVFANCLFLNKLCTSGNNANKEIVELCTLDCRF